MNNKAIKQVMRRIGKVTMDTLSDILNLIPVIGIPISTGAKILIGGVHESRDNIKMNKVKCQIEELELAINQKLISEEEVFERIQTQIITKVNQENEKKTVYMSGIILYTANGEDIRDDIKEELHVLFSGDYEYEGEYAELSKIVRDFLNEYLTNTICEDDDYYFFKDTLIMNFFFDYDRYLRDEKQVLVFIDALNKFLDTSPLREDLIFCAYSIF